MGPVRHLQERRDSLPAEAHLMGLAGSFAGLVFSSRQTVIKQQRQSLTISARAVWLIAGDRGPKRALRRPRRKRLRIEFSGQLPFPG